MAKSKASGGMPAEYKYGGLQSQKVGTEVTSAGKAAGNGKAKMRFGSPPKDPYLRGVNTGGGSGMTHPSSNPPINDGSNL
jgi:hypothetical protein